MIRMLDGIVTVHLDDDRYRGAYYFRGDKLVLIDMVREIIGEHNMPPGLSLQGSTTQMSLHGSTTQIGF